MEPRRILFDHEKLQVYQKAIDFSAWVAPLLEKISKQRFSASVVNQLDRASVSIPLNIAEGNGKRSKKDRCRFLDISRSSSLESASCLDVAVARRLLSADCIEPGRIALFEIVNMLTKLIDNQLREHKGR